MEFALVAPWIFFVFVGVLDFGFYAYWLMAVTNASRSAALATYQNGPSQPIACRQAINELRGVLGWQDVDGSACGSAPLTVTVRELTDSSTPPSADGARSFVVSVVWESKPLIPVPGIANQITIRRDTEVRAQ
jgi:Flp pilus assembly protein TadG